MNILQKILHSLDMFQRNHPVIGFPFAVVKKFGDDSGGYKAALITYYSFLSLFPLLLVLVTVLQLVFNGNPHLQQDIINKVGSYFPLLGDQLSSNISADNTKTGIGLVVGTAITLFGARGAADALRYAMNSIWQVPRDSWPAFPKAVLQSFTIMGLGALGFAATAAAGSFTSALGQGWWASVGVNAIGIGIATIIIALTIRTATARSVGLKDLWVGSALAAFIIQMLLTFGSILVANQLQNMSSLYGTFAVVLGLLFWIYLIAQVLVYCAQVDTVRKFKLWPRALVADDPTEADKQAYALYAKSEERIDDQKVKTRFKDS